MKILNAKLIVLSASLIIAMPSYGAKPNMVKEQPASGVAREAGYEGNYQFEVTSIDRSLATRCAQASRGLIMLDNKTWKRCGGKTKGAAESPSKPKDGHQGHH